MTTRRLPTLVRYLLWQLPGWVVSGALLALIVVATGLAWWIALAGLALLVARDIVLYPAMRATFRPPAPTRPVGVLGTTVEPLQPEGLVRVRGELWRACTVENAIPVDHEIVVTGAHGLTLFVARSRPR